MTNYEITGWQLSTTVKGVERLLLLIDSVTAGSSELCLEAHFKTVEDMERLSQVLPTSLYCCYCWSKIGQPNDLRRPEFKRLGEASFFFSRYEVSLSARPIPPTYDWDGKPSRTVSVALIDRNPHCTDEKRNGEAAVNLLQDVLREEVGQSGKTEVHIMNMTSDGSVCYRYLVQVPALHAPAFLERLFSRLGLSNGLSSFEFLGSADQIASIFRERLYGFENFPKGCRNFNGSSGKTSFALGRASFLYPVLNVRRDQCFAVAQLMDEFGDKIPKCHFVRKYLQWTLGNGMFSPRTQDNYVILSKQRVGCLLFVGVEQYGDEDPSVRRITASISPVLDELGMKLKRVSCFR